MKTFLSLFTTLRKFLLIVCLVIVCLPIRVGAQQATELTDDSILSIVAEKDFNADAYRAQLESMAGDDYKKFRALQERLGIGEQQRAEAEMAKKQRLWLIGILSLIIALIPAFTILKQVITGEVKPAGIAAVLKCIGVLLGWGIVLFALNFGWMWVLFSGNTKIMDTILGVVLLAFVVYAAISVNKYYKKLNDKPSR